MASLSNPNFQIDVLTGLPNDYRISGNVTVELTQFETFLVNAGLPLQLQSHVWGEDGGLYGRDELLFSFPSQNINAPGTYRFEAIVPRHVLNEDRSIFDQTDEISNRFKMVSGSNFFPLNVETLAPDIIGKF